MGLSLGAVQLLVVTTLFAGCSTPGQVDSPCETLGHPWDHGNETYKPDLVCLDRPCPEGNVRIRQQDGYYGARCLDAQFEGWMPPDGYEWREIYNETLQFPTKAGEPQINESFIFPEGLELYVNISWRHRLVTVESPGAAFWINATKITKAIARDGSYVHEVYPDWLCQEIEATAPWHDYGPHKTVADYWDLRGSIQSVGYCNIELRVVMTERIAVRSQEPTQG